MKTVTCRSCGNTGGEEFRLLDGTHRCPECGSTDLKVYVTLSEQVSVHEKLGLKARRAGEKKSFREVVTGDDLRKKDGKWMDKKRVIDREADTYDEVIIDPQTGETVHECHEALSEHKGHGSAKTRGRNASEQGRTMNSGQPVDFALSYAGPDEVIAREISKRLQELGFQVFFARERSHLIVGLDGESLFEKLFLAAKQVIVFISDHYKKRNWTRFEWDVIQERDPVNRFIPVRLDDSKILGLPSNILYLRFDGSNYDEIVRTCAMKLLAYEEQAGIHRETEFERILKAIRDDSQGELAKAYQLVADARKRDPLGDIDVPQSDYDVSYEVVKQEWCDFSRIRRLAIRAVVPPKLSQDELRFNLKHCAATAFNGFKPDAIMVFGYKDDPHGYTVDGYFTAARVILAPNGKWEDAEDGFAYNLPVDAFRYSIDFAAAYCAEAAPTEERDREVFWKLVELQDAIPESAPDYGQLNDDAKTDIAAQYEIGIDELNSIIRRGVEQHWPTPRPPSS